MIYVSSKEPKVIRSLIPEATQDDWPEEFGLDFAWITPFGVGGVQRKAFPSDFLASSSDERLAREVLQMGDVTFKALVVEGRQNWGTNGMLNDQYAANIHRDRFQAMVDSIDFFKHCRYRTTSSMTETIAFVRRFYKWTMKEYHTEFCAQVEYPKKKDENGNKIKVDWREWMLLHMPGISQVLARAILAYCPEPLQWWNGGDDLQKVPGIGPKRADKLIRALKSGDGD